MDKQDFEGKGEMERERERERQRQIERERQRQREEERETERQTEGDRLCVCELKVKKVYGRWMDAYRSADYILSREICITNFIGLI